MALTFDPIKLAALLADPAACAEINANVQDAFIKNNLIIEDITKKYYVAEGVVCNTPAVFDESIPVYDGLKSVPGCALPTKDISLNYSKKNWNPKPYGMRYEICYKDLAEGLKKFLGDPRCGNNVDMPDAIQNFLIKKIVEYTNNNIVARAWLGEANHTLDYLNGFDGWLMQLQDATPSPNVITLTENAGTNYAAQAITEAKAKDYMDAIYEKILSMNLDLVKDGRIYVTSELINMYFLWAWKNKQTCCFDHQDGMQQMYSKDNLSIAGIPLVPIETKEIKKSIVPFYNDNTKIIKPNMAIFTGYENLQLGTCSVGGFKNVKPQYDPINRKYLFDVEEITLDALVMDESKTVVLI